GEECDAEEEEAVPEGRERCGAVGGGGVADGNLHRLEAELRGAKDQLEIAEWIEIPEVTARGLDARVVGATHSLGAAQRVGEALRQKPGKEEREGLVGDEIEKAHRLLFHRIDQAGAVDELAFSRADRIPKLRQLLWRHGEIGVENHEHVAARSIKAGEHGIALPRSRLPHRLDLAIGISGGDALDLFPSAVLGMTLDEDDLQPFGETRDALDRRLDVAALVARGNDDAGGPHIGEPAQRAANGEVPQAELT